MITTYTFGKNFNTNPFYNNKFNSTPNLDDIIASSIAKKNSYLFNSTDTIILKNIGDTKKEENKILFGSDDSFKKALKFITGFKTYNNTYKLPYILGKMYTLTDGTPIVFYDDEIQIGFDTYKYDDFDNTYFLNTLTPKKTKIIIDIYNTAGINIDINLK